MGGALARREQQQRVAGRGVAVDGDGVEGLVLTPPTASSCNTAAGSAASVKTKASIVAISGAIMPEPLAMPLIVTLWPSISAVAVASLG